MGHNIDSSWKYKVEQDIQSLAQSISRLSVSLEKFIEHSKEMQNEKFSQIYEQLQDHETRIRINSKFVYQAFAIMGLITSLVTVLSGLQII